MAVKKFNTRIQLKNDSLTNWTLHDDLVLLGGEFAWNSTDKNFKIGDGTSAFSALDYAIPVANGTEITTTASGKFTTLGIGSIDGNKITTLNSYDSSTASGNVAPTDDLVTALEKIEKKVDSAIGGGITGITYNGASATVTNNIAALGDQVTTFGGASGAITLGTHLSMDGQQLKTDATGTGTLATTGDITTAIASLDVTAITGTAGQTITSISETDGVISATYSNISITSSQISDKTDAYASDSQVVVTGSAISNALATLDGSHDVATAAAYSPGTGESATYKLDIFDATETDGIVSTNNSAADTLYFSQAYSATNPILTKADIGSLSGAMHFKGTVDGTTTTLPTADITAGDVYIVSTAGTYAGEDCEVGDMIIAKSTKASGITDSDWTVVTGENQVTPVQGGAELVAGAAATTIGTVDGVALTAKTTVTAGSATIASKSGNTVTIKSGVTQGTGTGTIANDTGTDITLADVATTGSAADVAFAGEGFTATNASAALVELAGKITSANITIDGHKGAITTGNGLTDVAADGGSFAVLIDENNANGLSVGADGVVMAQATGASFGTVKVTTGNGLDLTNGVISYTHNTTPITVASKNTSTNVITINGELQPNASDVITTASSIALAAVAATGDASDVTVTAGNYGGTTTASDVQGALDNLTAAVAEGTNGNLITTNTTAQAPGSEAMSNDINLHKIAKTANPADLIQPSGDMIIFDCGSSTVNIASASGAIEPNASTPNA